MELEKCKESMCENAFRCFFFTVKVSFVSLECFHKALCYFHFITLILANEWSGLLTFLTPKKKSSINDCILKMWAFGLMLDYQLWFNLKLPLLKNKYKEKKCIKTKHVLIPLKQFEMIVWCFVPGYENFLTDLTLHINVRFLVLASFLLLPLLLVFARICQIFQFVPVSSQIIFVHSLSTNLSVKLTAACFSSL